MAPVTLATRADEAGGPPSKFYETSGNLSARAKRAYLDAAREQLLAMGASEDGVPSVAELLRWAEVAAEVPPDARKNASVSAWQEFIGAMPEATREEREAKLAELRAASPRGKVRPPSCERTGTTSPDARGLSCSTPHVSERASDAPA